MSTFMWIRKFKLTEHLSFKKTDITELSVDQLVE